MSGSISNSSNKRNAPLNDGNVADDSLRPDQRVVAQLCCATLPLFIVLSVFLIVARNRPNHPYYVDEAADGDYYNNSAVTAPPSWDLMEMLYVFLAFFLAFVNLLAYLCMYVPKRRQLIQTYSSQGQRVLGTVQFDSNSKCCRPACQKHWMVWNCSACFGLWRADYSDLIYSVKSDSSASGSGEMMQVTKMVRTYRPWIRERIPILVLPGLPRSGLAKDDVDLDIKSQSRNRINEIYYLIVAWIVFLVLGSIYLVVQMNKLHDERIHLYMAIWVLCGTVLAGPLLVYGFVYAKFMHYEKWITNSGMIVPVMGGGDGHGDVESAYSRSSQPAAYKAPLT
jgi:hypothetical protein